MAGAAEKFVNSVRELSTPGSVNALCNYISKSFDGLIKTPAAHLDNAWETLLPEEHSLAMLSIILAKYQQLEIIDATTGKKFYTVEPEDLEILLRQTRAFIQRCDPTKLLHALDSYKDMIHRLSELLIHRNEAARGIPIVTRAIEVIRANDSQLTQIHADLCHLCLSAKIFKPALPFLDVDITDMLRTPGQSSFDSKAFLLYYYYGGMIYAVEKNFKRAAFFFDIAVCTPSSAVSAIMVESYKKFVLVSLICNRCEPVLSKFASPMLARHIRAVAVPYQELAVSYSTSVQATLQATVDQHKAVYERDNNYGLVKQCIRSLYKKNIQKLTKTFLTLSLTDVANRVHLPTSADADEYLRKMIEEGEIYATINRKDGMVEFHDNPEKYNNPAMLKFLQQQEQKCIAMNSKLSEFERIIAVTPDFVHKMAAYSGEEDGSKASTSGQSNAENSHK